MHCLPPIRKVCKEYRLRLRARVFLLLFVLAVQVAPECFNAFLSAVVLRPDCVVRDVMTDFVALAFEQVPVLRCITWVE